jgi:hypothetical protein
MKSFLELLPTIARGIPTETRVRDFIMKYLQEICTISIDRKEIILSKNTIQLNISPIIRAKFAPHNELCLKELNKHLKENGVKLIIKRIM